MAHEAEAAAAAALRIALSPQLARGLGAAYGLEGADEESKLLLRFVRARKLQVDAAHAFLAHDFEWRLGAGAIGLRTQSLADALGTITPRKFSEFYERRLVGLDGDERPVFYQNYRRLIVRDLKKVYDLDKLERFHAWEQERAVSLVDELGRRGRNVSGKMAVVLDVGDMTIRKHVNSDFINVLKKLAGLDSNHFPERMGVTFVINAPGTFPMVWRMVRGFIDPVTAAKIFVLTEEEWRTVVAAELGAAVVEAIDEGVNLDPEFAAETAGGEAVPAAAVADALLERLDRQAGSPRGVDGGPRRRSPSGGGAAARPAAVVPPGAGRCCPPGEAEALWPAQGTVRHKRRAQRAARPPASAAEVTATSAVLARVEAELDVARLRRAYGISPRPADGDDDDAEDDDDVERLCNRFARARKGDVSAAFDFLVADLEWRIKGSLVEMRDESLRSALAPMEPRRFFEFYERRLVGLDLEERPVFYQNYRRLVVRDLAQVYDLDGLERFHAWEQERAVSLVDELWRGEGLNPAGKLAVVLDVGGMTVRKHINADFIAVLKQITAMDAAHFPERMGVTFVINAPRAFPLVWRMVRGFIDPSTAAKIIVLSDDWRDALSKRLGAHVAGAIDGGANFDGEFAANSSGCVLPPAAVIDALLRGQTLVDTDVGGDEYDDDVDVFADARSNSTIGSDDQAAPDDRDAHFFRKKSDARRARKLVKCVAAQWTLAILLTIFAGQALHEGRWVARVAIQLSLAALPFGGIGVLGAHLGNAAVLAAHVLMQGVVASALVVIGGLALAAAAGSDEYNNSSAALRNGYLRVGCCILIEVAVLVPQIVVAHAFARRLARRKAGPAFFGQVDAAAEATTALRACANLLAAFGVVSLAFSASAIEYFLKHKLANAVFAPYMLFEGALMLVGCAGLSRWAAAPSRDALGVLRFAGATLASTTLFYCASLGVTASMAVDVERHVRRGGRARQNVAAGAFSAMVITAGFQMLVILTLLTTLRTALNIHATGAAQRAADEARADAQAADDASEQGRAADGKPGARRGGDVEAGGAAATGGARAPRSAAAAGAAARLRRRDDLSNFERGAIVWGVVTGLLHVFVDGTFAIFSRLVAMTGGDGSLRIPWFVAIWRAWSNVDSRYKRSDGFIVCQVSAMAIFVGPACLAFACATFERVPYRHTLGVITCLAQLWTLGLYFATAAHAQFRDIARPTHFLYFWVLFIGLTVARCLLPLPILFASVRALDADAKFKLRWDALLHKAELDSVGALDDSTRSGGARQATRATVSESAPLLEDASNASASEHRFNRKLVHRMQNRPTNRPTRSESI
ncbi:hypothetical protein M885DRAFT_624412 [Pelagophyceae sp. CCMP2097]|nr:hypothetical protein M885DRAFT_624412 [Pelagophyceae sp. CCMP2097]